MGSAGLNETKQRSRNKRALVIISKPTNRTSGRDIEGRNGNITNLKASGDHMMDTSRSYLEKENINTIEQRPGLKASATMSDVTMKQDHRTLSDLESILAHRSHLSFSIKLLPDIDVYQFSTMPRTTIKFLPGLS